MKQLKSFLFFSVVCTIHILSSEFLLKLEINLFLIKSYFFLFLLSLFSVGCIYLLNKLKNKSPFYFLTINGLKIIASILYLLPFLSNKTEMTIYYIMHFFIAYFIILIKEGRENYMQLKAENNH
jgi:hypothetical protein